MNNSIHKVTHFLIVAVAVWKLNMLKCQMLLTEITTKR
jgi:uncharacterized membrane protein YwzB